MLNVLPEDRRKGFVPLAQMLRQWMLFIDPPEHSRLRKLLDKGFSIEAIDGNPKRTLDEAEAAQTAVVGLTDYFREAVAHRRQHTGKDLISLLLQIEEDGEMLTEDELYAQCVMLLFAGHEPTQNWLGDGILTLLKNPKAAGALKDDAGDMRSAVEELLRYDSPLQAITRAASDDLEYGGVHMRAGEVVMVVLSSANRDPKCFKEPDSLDLGRKNNSHLAFGVGRHFCIGNQVARRKAQVPIPPIFGRFPRMHLVGPEPKWIFNFSFRGLESLRVSLR